MSSPNPAPMRRIALAIMAARASFVTPIFKPIPASRRATNRRTDNAWKAPAAKSLILAKWRNEEKIG